MPLRSWREVVTRVKARGLDMLIIFDNLQRRQARNMDDLTSSLLFGLDGS